jgi:2',3'-cyclic-nucleotide 2'-phosphodiesterase (5'-nucleotidase family)
MIMAFELQILHASDLEGGVDGIDDAPNFAAVVDALRGRFVNTITVSAGDNYIPGPFFAAASDASLSEVFNSIYNSFFGLPGDLDGDGTAEQFTDLGAAGGRVDASIMNFIGFDASAVGNHEFDLGPSTFAEVIAPDIGGDTLAEVGWLGTQFPYLSSNLDFSGEPALAGLFTDEILPTTAFQSAPFDLEAAAAAPKLAPASIIERSGEQIGVVGATTTLLESISSTGGIEVKEPGAGTEDPAALAEVIQPTIDALEAAGVNKIVLMSHLQQLSFEQDLAPLLSGVDVMIAGGSDTILADDTDVLRPGDVAAGDYPIITENPDGDPVAIVSTDGEYSYVGRLVLTFDDAGVLDPASIDPAVSGAFATTDEVVEELAGEDAFAEGTPASLVAELTDAVREVVTAQDGNIFGQTEVFLDGRRTEVRTEETNLGNVSADANLALAQQVDPTVLVSMKNGGGIRAPIGEIVQGGRSGLLPAAAGEPRFG